MGKIVKNPRIDCPTPVLSPPEEEAEKKIGIAVEANKKQVGLAAPAYL